MILGGADQHDEFVMAIENGPDHSYFTQRSLSRSTRHREREQKTRENRSLDSIDCCEVIVGPAEIETLTKVRLAEEPEIKATRLASLGVVDLGNLANVTTGARFRGHASGHLFAMAFVLILIVTRHY